MPHKVRMPNGKTMECERYLPATYRACVTCRFWSGCRYFDAMGRRIFGVGFDGGLNLGNCGAQNNMPKPGTSTCSRWIGLN